VKSGCRGSGTGVRYDEHPLREEIPHMPGLMGRATLIVKAKFSKALDRAENPGETLDYSYEEQLRQLQNVKRGIADVTTAKKRLELQYTSMQQQADKLDGQARQALQANREDLAREALARKAAVQGQLEGIMQQGQQLEAQQQKLIDGEKTLQAKVESFRTQKEVIKAQYSAAEAQVRIGEAASGIGENMADVGLAIQRAKDKTEQMQARAGAIEELSASGALEDFTSQGDDIDRQLAQLSQGNQVDSEIERMKAELGQAESAKALPSADDEAPAASDAAAAAPAPKPEAQPES
jgi:phage shock protein A